MNSSWHHPNARRWWQRGLLAGLFLMAAVRGAAVERRLQIEAPAAVAAGQTLAVVFLASTDAGRGEQVGFLQAEMSLDGGKTWTPVCYLVNLGASAAHAESLKPGPAGSTVRLRVRAAFRDGLAGDVDFSGAAIRWHENWADWMEPPSRLLTIPVKAP
jgi:hypothetical protein